MKLEKTVQYILRKRIRWCILFALTWALPLHAQHFNSSFKKITLSDALTKASDNFGLKIAFDYTNASQIIIDKDVKGNTPEEYLANLLDGTPLTFVFKHNSFLIIPRPISAVPPVVNKYELIGSISDNESGECLPFASICLADSKNNFGTPATATGTFSFKNITSNPIRLYISLIGYYPLDTLLQLGGIAHTCVFKMRKKVQLMDSVIVKNERLEMVDLRPDQDFATAINPSKMIDLPVLAETDVFRALQLLPGVKYSESTSELSIRGGSSDQNLVLFDGQTLYNLSHYYGVVSILNPNVIKDVQIFKGGYESKYGERVSGIVDITGKAGAQNKPVISGDINLVSGNITAEIPVSKKLTLVAAARRSYSDIYETEFAKNLFKSNTSKSDKHSDQNVTESTPSFRFYDYNTKLTYRVSNKENLSLSYYGGRDFFDNTYGGSNDTKKQSYSFTDKNNWSNYGISASWAKQWNSTYYSFVQVGKSGYSNEASSTNLVNFNTQSNDSNSVKNYRGASENNLRDFSLNFKNLLTIGRNQIEIGFTARQNGIYFKKGFGTSFVYDSIKQRYWLSSSYLQDKIYFGKFYIKPGLRLSHYQGTNNFYFEPRLSANYNITPKLSVRMATGKYCQFINQVASLQESGYTKNFWLMSDTGGHPVVKANHYILGSTFNTGNFIVDLEGYYKTYSGFQEYIYVSVPTSDYKSVEGSQPVQQEQSQQQLELPAQQYSYFIDGTGRMYGIDLMVRYKYHSYTGWVSYSVGRSLQKFKAINNGVEIPAPTDQIHQISYTNMFSWRKWNFGSIMLFYTGKPYVSSPPSNNITIIRQYSRMPNYFRTDLSANYRFNIGKLNLKTGLSILNIFNTTNYYDMSSKRYQYETMSLTETNLIRSQARSLNVSIHFQF